VVKLVTRVGPHQHLLNGNSDTTVREKSDESATVKPECPSEVEVSFIKVISGFLECYPRSLIGLLLLLLCDSSWFLYVISAFLAPSYIISMLQEPVTSVEPSSLDVNPIGFPAPLMLLSYIMWNMTFVGLLLRCGGWIWSQWCVTYLGPFNSLLKLFKRLVSLWKSLLRKRKPPDKPRSFWTMTLAAALRQYAAQPALELKSDKKLKHKLRRKLAANGQLLTLQLTSDELAQVRKALTRFPTQLVNPDDLAMVIIDSGASNCVSGF